MIEILIAAAAAAVEEEAATETIPQPPELVEDPNTVNWTVVVLGVVSLVFYFSFLRPTMDNPTASSTGNNTDTGGLQALHEHVLNAFYKQLKGGVVISCGDKYMIAIEFDGPYGNGGIEGEMTFVDKDPKAQAVVKGRKCKPKDLGTKFLEGEPYVYYVVDDESEFFALLSKYKASARYSALVDVKSGLPLFHVNIAK